MSELTKEYFDKKLDKLATKEYLLEFSNEIIFPRVEEIIDERLLKLENTILTSDDKLSIKLDKILKEQVAHTQSYKRLEKRVNYLEAVVKVLAEKAGIKIDSNFGAEI